MDLLTKVTSLNKLKHSSTCARRLSQLKRRRFQMETLESRIVLDTTGLPIVDDVDPTPGELIGVDFGSDFDDISPSNWNFTDGSNLLLTDLFDETGHTTPYDLEITSDNPVLNDFGEPTNIPQHPNVLTEIGGNLYSSGGDIFLQFSDLEPLEEFEIYVLGLDTTGIDSNVTIAGDGVPLSFQQVGSGHELFVNDQSGDSTRNFTSYAKSIVASSEGTIDITVTEGNDFAGLAGVAIRPHQQAVYEGEIHGTKWNDLDGNGNWDTDEPGLAGVTIFLDQNNNGTLDTNELSTVTSADHADTPQDETGSYLFSNLPSGVFTVAEVVPVGYEQTYPNISTLQTNLTNNENTANSLDAWIVGGKQTRIVGGQDANAGEYPWMVSVQDNYGDHFCGGALIATEWVVTAAHCVEFEQPTDIQLQIGPHDISDASQGETIEIDQIISHPDYDPESLDSDIALFHLTSSANSTPIAMAAPNQEDPLFLPGVNATITGWGAIYEDGPDSDILQEIVIPIVSNAEADIAVGGGVTDNMIAAGVLEGGLDSCQGDSGGPMMVSDGQGGLLHAGVVSWGVGCAQPNSPGLYTRTANFKSWIDDILGDTQPSAGTHSVTLGLNEVIHNINFGNHNLVGNGLGEIHGVQWLDVDGDGQKGTNEAGLEGWQLYLDTDNDGELDANEPFTLTNNHGEFSFVELPAENYTVRYIPKEYYAPTFPVSDAWNIDLNPDAMVENINFGTQIIDGVTIQYSTPNGFTASPGETIPVTISAIGSPEDISAFQLNFHNSSTGPAELILDNWTTDTTWNFALDSTLATTDLDESVAAGSFGNVVPTVLGSFALTVSPAAVPGSTFNLSALAYAGGTGDRTEFTGTSTNVIPLLDGSEQSIRVGVVPEVTNVAWNVGFTDPPSSTPTTWSQQRSGLFNLEITFNTEIDPVAVTDLVLTNLGVDANTATETTIPLDNAQFDLKGNVLTVTFTGPPSQHINQNLPDGVYQLVVNDTITSMDIPMENKFIFTGDSDNRFYKLTGDWNGDGGVGIADFSTLVQWFNSPSAPEYVNLNGDGGVGIADFAIFVNNFHTSVNYPVNNVIEPPIDIPANTLLDDQRMTTDSMERNPVETNIRRQSWNREATNDWQHLPQNPESLIGVAHTQIFADLDRRDCQTARETLTTRLHDEVVDTLVWAQISEN